MLDKIKKYIKEYLEYKDSRNLNIIEFTVLVFISIGIAELIYYIGDFRLGFHWEILVYLIIFQILESVYFDFDIHFLFRSRKIIYEDSDIQVFLKNNNLNDVSEINININKEDKKQ